MADAAPVTALPPPSGENNSGELIRSLAAVGCLSLVFMILRFFCKMRYAKGFGVDDAILALGFACLIASIVLECISTQYGMGMHIWEIVDFAALAVANKYLFVGEFFGIIGIAFAKTSFCLTLLRLAVKPWHRILIWTCAVTINLFMWPCAITFFVGCVPLAKKFDPSVPGTCVDNEPIVHFAVFAGVWSAMTDFILAIFPWFLVWNLQMRRVERFGVCICMSIGVLSGIFAIIKSASLIPSLEDYTYKSTPLLIWSSTELGIVIMASSIPFLRLFYKELRTMTSSGFSRGKSAYAKSSDYNMKNMSGFNKMDNSHSASGSKNRTHVETTKDLDDSSDKSILAVDVRDGHRIVRTDEVTVERTLATKDLEGQPHAY